MEKGQEIAIQQALEFIRTKFTDENLRVPQIARKVGYSEFHLCRIFHKATGKGILSHVLEMRMEKAKNLLCETSLSIDEIGFAVGMGGGKRFHRAFSKKVGCAPTTFRKSQGIAEGALPGLMQRKGEEKNRWFYEPFKIKGNAPDKAEAWKKSFEARRGNWTQENDFISGTFSGDGSLAFREILPENFRVSFEARLIPGPTFSSSEIDIFLQDTAKGASYCILRLGKNSGAWGEFLPRNFGKLINPGAVCEKNKWNKIEFTLEDDTVKVVLNDRELFTYKDPFPMSFSQRSNLIFGGYSGTVQIREFEVFDLGFLPLVRNVRAGDSLFNSGFFSAARDFYMRLLTSRVSASDAMELRYKIGQCFLSEEIYVQARIWMEKVIALPQTGFWAQQAGLGLFEISLREERLEVLSGLLQNLFKNPIQRDSACGIVEKTCSEYADHGFLEKALFLRNLLCQAETGPGILHLAARIQVAETLYLLRRQKEAELNFKIALSATSLNDIQEIHILFSLGHCLALQGKLTEWIETITLLDQKSKHDLGNLCRLEIERAYYYLATGDFETALSCLSHIPIKFPEEKYTQEIALLYTSLVNVCNGAIDKAREAIQDAEKLNPRHTWLRKGNRSRSYYPVEMVDGNFAAAAQYLWEDSQENRNHINGAEYGIKAGIMQSLAGNQEEACKIWTEISDYYPESRFYYLGNFAQALAGRKILDPHPMPLPADRFAEMLYLLGLLCEKWEDKDRSRWFFKQCIAENLSMGWPGYLAKKKMLDAG